MKITAFFKNKKFRHGGLSVIMTAVFVAVIILINIAAGMLFKRFDISFDVSGNRIFSIDSETSAFLSALTDTVTITVMSREGDFAAYGEYHNQTNEILKRFNAASDKITLKYIDLMSNPDFAAKYKNELTQTSIIFESAENDRYKILYESDYLKRIYYDMQGNIVPEEYAEMYRVMYGYLGKDVFATAEDSFITAILAVTDENPINVGRLTGFGESRNPQTELLLEKNAYIIHDIDIVLSDIPEDFDFLIIDTPTADYSDSELAKISAWLDNDGKFGKTLLYFSPAFAETPNFDSFLRDWGIEVERAYVFQRDGRYGLSGEGLGMNVQYYVPHDFTEDFNPSYQVYGGLMRHVRQVFEARSNMTTRPLISTYDGAVILPFSVNDDDSDFDMEKAPTGAFSVAVQSTKTRYEGDGFDAYKVTSDILVFGSGQETGGGNGNLFNPYFMSMQNSNNAEFFINMMNGISGKDTETTITITPKSFSVPLFEITENQTRIIGIIFMLALPLTVVAVGVVIWIRRIRK
ncbi:MAG: GldG family protein [Oscillospiraceae bacterium]|nr:GldG family protein [Oscillospiraceae bacterium]